MRNHLLHLRLPACYGVVAGIILLAASGWSRAEDWPQFRGAAGQGISLERDLPTHWHADSTNIRWITPIPGDGSSSPVVSAGRVYLTTAYEGEQRNPIDTTASGLAMFLAACVACSSLLQPIKAFRRDTTSGSTPGWNSGTNRALLMHTFVVALLTTTILAKPKWFWRFPDPWSGSQVRDAELPFVESLYLRAVFVFYSGSLVVVFAALAFRACRQANSEAPPFLARCMKVLSAICVLSTTIACFLVVWRPEWFWVDGQPWMTWIISGGLILLAVGAGAGWLPETRHARIAWAGLGFLLAGGLYWKTPLDESNLPIDAVVRAGYLMPGFLLLLGHGLVSAMARRRAWPTVSPSGWAFPLLLAAMSLLVFVRSNMLHPESGMLRVVLCLDQRTGGTLWETPVFISPTEKKHSLNTFATPTPATDGLRVYADFGSGLVALDQEGKILWLVRDFAYPCSTRYGSGSSPVLAGDLLIVYHDHEWQGHGNWRSSEDLDVNIANRPSTLTAYDKFTGQVVWSVAPEFSHDSYMTPLVWQHAGQSEVVIATWKTLAGFDLKTGELCWQREHPMWQIVPSLILGEDRLIVSGGNALPYQMDAIRPPLHDDPGATIWHSKKGAPSIASPVFWEGLVFSVADPGLLFCRDIATGKIIWSSRLRGRFLASLVAADGKVYALNTEGVTYVVAASRKENCLAQNPLGESCSATPAIADGCLFIRSEHHLYCIGKEAAKND